MCLRVPGGRKPYLPQRTQVKNSDVILSHGALQEGGVVQHQPGVALPHACGINHTRTGAKGAHISLENAIYWENPNSWRCPLCCMTRRDVLLAVEPWAVSELDQPRMVPVVLLIWNCRVQDPARRCLRKGLEWHWLAGARADRMQRGSAGGEGTPSRVLPSLHSSESGAKWKWKYKENIFVNTNSKASQTLVRG